MTKRAAKLCKKYCGAVAVSWYRSEYTLKAIELLTAAGVKTNIHYVLDRHTAAEALQRLKERSFPTGVNAVVFLLHKPVGLGSYDNMIRQDNEYFRNLIEYVASESGYYKIGFDSCTIPALIRHPGNIDTNSLQCMGGCPVRPEIVLCSEKE